MCASRADFRRFRAFVDVATISANPSYRLGAFEYQSLRDILRQSKVSLFVPFLSDRYVSKDSRDLSKALFVRGFCKARIHLSMFVILTCGGGLEVLKCVTDDAGRKRGRNLHLATLEKFELTLGVLLLLVSGLFEDGGNLLVALTVSRLGLAGKRSQQIPLGLTTFQIHY